MAALLNGICSGIIRLSTGSRHYWPEEIIAKAVSDLIEVFKGKTVPETTISQHLRGLFAGVRGGNVEPTDGSYRRFIDDVLKHYFPSGKVLMLIGLAAHSCEVRVLSEDHVQQCNLEVLYL